MAQDQRIVIIGDGVVGWSTAVALLNRGYRQITVVGEGRQSGPSWWDYAGLLRKPLDAELGVLFESSLEVYRGLGVPVSGPTSVVLLGQQQRVEDRALEAARFRELKPTMLTAREVVRLGVPSRWSACRLHDEGYLVSPRRVMAALRDEARRHVEFRHGTATLSFESDGVCRGVLIGGQPLDAWATVIAAGADAGRLTARAGRRGVRLEPRWGVAAVLAGVLPPTTALLEVAVERAQEEILQDTIAFVLVGVPNRTPGGPTCVLGSTFSRGARPDPSSYWPALREHGQDFYPALEHARLMSLDVYARPVTPDGRPYIGCVPETNVWIGGGAGSTGLGIAWAIGATLARAINAGTDDVVPDAFRPARKLPL
jgi:glycine/D-amino acid oxidase-like deaminating enzyme